MEAALLLPSPLCQRADSRAHVMLKPAASALLTSPRSKPLARNPELARRTDSQSLLVGLFRDICEPVFGVCDYASN